MIEVNGLDWNTESKYTKKIRRIFQEKDIIDVSCCDQPISIGKMITVYVLKINDYTFDYETSDERDAVYDHVVFKWKAYLKGQEDPEIAKSKLEYYYIKQHGRIIAGYCSCCGAICELSGKCLHTEECLYKE